MSEAEKKWELWAGNRVGMDKTLVLFGIRTYKAALRREIEKEKAILLSEHYSSYALIEAQRLDNVLTLLDTVEP